ncbi:MAG TPA: CRTAC1 family protein [Pyrinomonadaceae bacterium]|nr:CRTAC1 family protein [Pyrinomonadaceae bacterium]
MRNRSRSQVSTLAAALVSLTLQVTIQQRPSFAVTDLKEGFLVRTLETGHKSAAGPILKTATDPLPARHLMSPLVLNDGRELWMFPAQQPVKTAEQSKTPPTKFEDVTSALGLNFQHIASHTSRKYLIETMGSGVALFDYDNDGRLDIFAVNAAPLSDPTPKGTIPQKTGPKYWNRLYHQKQDGTFEDVTERTGLQGVGYGMGVAVGDYDNDGYEDLYVTAYGGNKLYRNNGDGKFTDVTEKAGVGGSGWSTSAAWVDLDGDGLLDLFVLRYMQWDFDDIWCGERKEGYRAYCNPDAFHPTTPFVYQNDGKGHFSEVSRKIGLAEPGKGLGIALADYDRDGRIDIFVANDSMVEFLYHNKGDGRFEEVALKSGVAVDGEGHTYAGMGVDFADYNNDGLPDLVVTDLANQMYALYRNDGDGIFTYDTYPSGIGRMTMMHSGWGVRFLDCDNDGWKDLLIAQGHDLDTIELTFPNLRYREPLLLARNTGQVFVDVSAEAGSVFREAWVGRGMAIGDIDNDGLLDAVVTTNDGALYVLRNATQNQYHWLILRLVGHKSNRDGIGADVKVVIAKGSQLATVSTASSYLSASDKRVHFGLGTATAAEMIEIRWPSGIRQTLKNVHGDQILQIDEPVGVTGNGPRR